MSEEAREATGPVLRDTAPVWDLGSAFGASLRAWNRRPTVPEGRAHTPGAARIPEHPRVLSSRTRCIWHEQ
jgi:hypothetical protein